MKTRIVLLCMLLLISLGAQGFAQVARKPKAQMVSAEPSGITFVRWVEPKEHSFSIEVPRGWSVDGGVNWLSDIDPEGFVRLQSPDRKMSVFFGDPQILSRQVPTPMGRMQAGVNEGQVFRTPSGGPALLERYMTGIQYAKRHVTWRMCQAPTWVAEKERPDDSRAMADALAPETRKYRLSADASAGEVTYTCGTMQGAAAATTYLVGQGGPIQVWGVYRVAGFQSADPLHSMQARLVMEHLLASFANDPAWTADLERRTRERTGAVISMQNAATQSSLAASRQQNETLARLNHPNAGVPRQNTSSGGARGSSGGERNIQLGTEHVCDAIDRCTTVSTSDGPQYMDHSGNVRRASAGGGPPDNTGVWSPLYH